MWYGINERNFPDVNDVLYMYMSVLYIYICVCVCVVYSVSSPYQLVFGDDRVRGTREQMMLQVDLVMLGDGAGIAWEFL